MKIYSLAFILALLAPTALAQGHVDPQYESELLLSALVPFAEQMLETYGEFFPFGGAMTADGEIVFVAVEDDTSVSSQELIDLVRSGFREGAESGEYRATALVFDVVVRHPTSGERSDAIAISLDHSENYSVIVYFPYKLEDGHLHHGWLGRDRGFGHRLRLRRLQLEPIKRVGSQAQRIKRLPHGWKEGSAEKLHGHAAASRRQVKLNVLDEPR
jgi:hypothetical protein